MGVDTRGALGADPPPDFHTVYSTLYYNIYIHVGMARLDQILVVNNLNIEL